MSSINWLLRRSVRLTGSCACLFIAASATTCLAEISRGPKAAPELTIAQDGAQLPDTQSIGPLRRGPNGELEVATPKSEARTCPAAAQAGANDAYDGLPPGHWMEVPNSHLASVLYAGPLARSIFGNTGPSAIMAAWSGGAFDTTAQSLIIWGGGHQDYYGNEVYAFSIKTQSWRMLDQPSSIAAWDRTTPILPDGSPSAQHTYDGLAMLPDRKLFVAGSPAATPNGNGYGSSWLFDIANTTWHRAGDFEGSSYGNIAEYDPVDRKVYVISPATGLQSYDPAPARWSRIGRGVIANGHMTGALDPRDELLVAVGGGALQAIKLTLGIVSEPSNTGDRTIIGGNAPGFVWDSATNLFVGWNGGSTVYTLDPRRWQWTVFRAAPDNRVTPTLPAANGTFGRFQYDERDKVFILVNDTQQNVYLYRDCFERHGD